MHGQIGFETEKGIPEFYDVFGESLWLEPAPDTSQVTAASGLKIYGPRDQVYFIDTDATKVPPFISAFHSIVLKGMAYEYTSIHGPKELKADLYGDIQVMLNQVTDFFSTQNADDKARIIPHRESYS